MPNDPIKLLSDLVSINSIFPNEKASCKWAEKKLKELGFKTSRQYLEDKNRFNIVGERGSVGKSILFYSHIDTVPIYGNWKADPFKLREEGDKLIGRGAYDIKSGVTGILKACEIQTDRKIKVVFGADEENISEGSEVLCKTDFIKDVECAVVAEILDIPNAKANMIMLGRRGRTVYEIIVPGRSAHGGHIKDGINAISEAARLIPELDKFNEKMKEHKELPKATQFTRKIQAESTSLSIPEYCTIELDRHLVTPETPESVLKEIRSFVSSLYKDGKFREIDGRKIEVIIKERKTEYLMPYVTSKSDPLTGKISDAMRKAVGEPAYCYGASVADENRFAAKGIPVVTIGPVGGNQHAAEEWASKDSYLKMIRVLEEFIKMSG